MNKEFKSYTFEDTISYGKQIGKTLQGGEVIVLTGLLGSGKTAVAKGIAQGIGVNDIVTSPSFSVMNEYRGRYYLYHFDFYRIVDKAEMETLLEDYIYQKNGISVIEWGEKIIDVLDSHLCVQIKLFSAYRLITVERRGLWFSR